MPRPRRHMMSTRLSVSRCPHCAQRTFAAWTEGVFAHVDPVALSIDGESAVRASGRETYRVTGGELVLLDSDNARALNGALLLAGHVCGQAVAHEHRPQWPKPHLGSNCA